MPVTETFKTGDSLSPEQMDVLYRSFDSRIFRLEALDHYDVAGNEPYKAFVAGHSKASVDTTKSAWSQLVEDATASGKRWDRVHLVVNPISSYVAYEIESGYPKNIASGEGISILSGEAAQQWASWSGKDFWMFDDTAVVWMNYDPAGRIISRTFDNTDESLAMCKRARDAMIEVATPYATYVQTYVPWSQRGLPDN